MHMLITNNEEFQITIAKSALSNDDTIYALENSDFFSPVTFIKCLHSCRSKLINKNNDNKKPFSPVILTKRLCSCRNKYVSKDSKDSD